MYYGIMPSIGENIAELRCFANLFSASALERFVVQRDTSYLKTLISRYGIHSNESVNTIGDYYNYAFNSLLKNYRNEYVYKNLILNKLLLGKHRLTTTTIINEFRIGTSIADLVMINGCAKVFEIKTELDSPYRVNGQLADYRKVFENVYLVTHHSLVEKYVAQLDSHVGVIALTKNNTLSIVRESLQYSEELDSETMFRCLRKAEYSAIIKSYYGALPDATPARYFTVCKELFAEIPVAILYKLMLSELKKRSVKEKEKFASNEFSHPVLKQLLWNLNFSAEQYDKLVTGLNTCLSLQ